MFAEYASDMSTPLVQAIEDAILLGGSDEISEVLDAIGDDESLPADVKYGLEALHYFRKHYGKGGDLEPTAEAEKRTALCLDSLWGRELLEKVANLFRPLERASA